MTLNELIKKLRMFARDAKEDQKVLMPMICITWDEFGQVVTVPVDDVQVTTIPTVENPVGVISIIGG